MAGGILAGFGYLIIIAIIVFIVASIAMPFYVIKIYNLLFQWYNEWRENNRK